MTENAFHIAEKIAALHQKLKDATQDVRCAPEIVAVSKQQPLARIEAALESGHRLFGENRVQEAQSKWPALKARYTNIQLHLIGPLQSNKAKDAFELFDVIETLDRMKLAEALYALYRDKGKGPRLLVQVNTGEEAQKSGLAPREVNAFVAQCMTMQLPIEGLMCIPPADADSTMHFKLLSDLANQCGLKTLSMGMSGDYLEAAKCGASWVRLGTAIFGERM